MKAEPLTKSAVLGIELALKVGSPETMDAKWLRWATENLLATIESRDREIAELKLDRDNAEKLSCKYLHKSVDLESRLAEYKTEWESCCERERSTFEELKERRQDIDDLKKMFDKQLAAKDAEIAELKRQQHYEHPLGCSCDLDWCHGKLQARLATIVEIIDEDTPSDHEQREDCTLCHVKRIATGKE